MQNTLYNSFNLGINTLQLSIRLVGNLNDFLKLGYQRGKLPKANGKLEALICN